MIKLKGITWDHARGFNPLVGTTAEFIKEHPEISIEWSKRTLAEFGDFPVEKLAENYDLLLIDHPFTGEASAKNLYVNLEQYLTKEQIGIVEKNSIGKTYESYIYDDKVLALPVDAAALVSSVRGDLIEQMGLATPKCMEEVFDLAKKLPNGKYIDVALCHIDIWCVLLSLCGASGGQDFFHLEKGFPIDLAIEQIAKIRELAKISYHNAYRLNPIQILDKMAQENEVVYSPYLFGYVNYSVEGNYKHIVEFYDAPLWEGAKTQTILGGVGIAISTFSKYPKEAAQYIEYVTRPEIQKGLYFQKDGQPAHYNAWNDEENNKVANDFFKNTLNTIEQAYVRPRVPKWNQFQESGSLYLWEAVQNGTSAKEIVEKLDQLYQNIVLVGK